jgi:hypothetical protein
MSLSKITLVVCTMAATADAKLLRSNTAVRVGAKVAAEECPYPAKAAGDVIESTDEFYTEEW